MNNLTYQITNKDIKWLQKQYYDRFGITLDKETAHRKLHKLVRQMELIYRPITKKQASIIKKEV